MTIHGNSAEAVHCILSALEESLREDCPLPSSVALFCANSFASFVDSKAWRGTFGAKDADQEFAALDRSQESALDRMLGTGARLSESRLRKIATAFCVALGLSRHSKKAPMHYPGFPNESACSPECSVRIPRESRVSVPAELVAVEAKGGDPGALRQILTALVCALRGSHAMPRRHVCFCAEALRTLLDDSDAWVKIRRPDASSNSRRYFGRAVCRAFHLSKSNATLKDDESPRNAAACPPAVLKFEELLFYGVSLRAAKSIILTAFRKPGPRSLNDWLVIMEIESVKVGTLGEYSLIEHRLDLAGQVERATAARRNLDQAYLVVARSLASKLFPDTRSQMVRWAAQILRDSRRRHRPSDQVELAQRIIEAVEQERPFPRVPAELAQRIVPRIMREKAKTRLPESAVRKLLPAVRKAHRFALSLNTS